MENNTSKKRFVITLVIVLLIAVFGVVVYAKNKSRVTESAVVSENATSTVKLISPNGGETYAKSYGPASGTPISITYRESENGTTHTELFITDLQHSGTELSLGSSAGRAAADGISSTSWVIPENFPSGKYKIQVCKFGTNICDFSDDFFTITN